MAILPDARRRGAGGAVLAALADWAVSQGFSRLYLQVEQNNTAALRLYRRTGFEEVCIYHYALPHSPPDLTAGHTEPSFEGPSSRRPGIVDGLVAQLLDRVA
jgi:Acetyltransferase (GNAT) family